MIITIMLVLFAIIFITILLIKDQLRFLKVCFVEFKELYKRELSLMKESVRVRFPNPTH